MGIRPVVLIVLDGWGESPLEWHNAIFSARTPNFDSYRKDYAHTTLVTSGERVGLPEGQMGNSEVGHMTIGAGKIIDTDIVRIKKAIQNGEFAKNEKLQHLFHTVNEHGSCLHVMGLLSDGGIHSHHEHLFAFLRSAKDAGVQSVAMHLFLDGRDTAPTNSVKYLQELDAFTKELGLGTIATIGGRYFGMDRDNNWDRLEKMTDAMFGGKGKVCAIAPADFVKEFHGQGISDEHIEPFLVGNAGQAPLCIAENDGIFFFNFRSDRARMLTEKLLEKKDEYHLSLVTMTEYKKGYDVEVLFPPMSIETTIAKEVSEAGLTQVHIAETEKFPHATYFLNGGVEELYAGEKRVLLDSRKDVATHDLAPEMRARDIAKEAVREVEAGADFVFINFANADMVGHTANVPAVIEALEITDEALGQVVNAVHKKGGVVIITADHGNAEMNVDENGAPHTAHTYNVVPCIITNTTGALRAGGTLADIAPMVLALMGLLKPGCMTGVDLREF